MQKCVLNLKIAQNKCGESDVATHNDVIDSRCDATPYTVCPSVEILVIYADGAPPRVCIRRLSLNQTTPEITNANHRKVQIQEAAFK